MIFFDVGYGSMQNWAMNSSKGCWESEELERWLIELDGHVESAIEGFNRKLRILHPMNRSHQSECEQ